MCAAEAPGWLGYALDRSKGRVGVAGLGDRVLLLGRRAAELSTLVAFAGAEAGGKTAVLDVDGSISPDIHGYFEPLDYRSMLYEAFHLEGEAAMHGQLVAAAYAAALDLAPEEESILSAALQSLAEQNDLATPSSLFDAIGGVEGFRGFYVDKLKGRIGSLKFLETTRVESFDRLMKGGVLVSFSSAPYPQAADLAACLYLAKILHLLAAPGRRPDAVHVTGAHRLFRGVTKPPGGGRLLAHLLGAQVGLVVATPLPALLDDRLIESMPVRIYSSEAWNARKTWKQAAALASSYTAFDDRSGSSVGFFPRFIRPRRGPTPRSSPPAPFPSPELTRMILEEVGRFEAANRQSVISYLAPLFLSADVGAELDRLHSEGYLVLEPKEFGSGPKILSYTVTEEGGRLLRGLTG